VSVANITPEALAVLSRVKGYGLGTWRPGRFVISAAHDVTFARSNSAILTELIAGGYLSVDGHGDISTGLAGEHELRTRGTTPCESRSTIRGRRFSVVTDGWASQTLAGNARQEILAGLSVLAESDSEEFTAVADTVSEGLESDTVTRLVQSVTGLPRSEEGRRVGIRIYGT
jgi:hypothetical protein